MAKVSSADQRRRNLHRFETAVYLLMGRALRGTTAPDQLYGNNSAIGEFFGRHPGEKDGMWANAHMYAAHPIFSPEQGAAIWFRDCCLPEIFPDRYKYAPDQYEVWHRPQCESCGADLMRPNTITVAFSCAEHVFERMSQVTEDGQLADVDNLIEHGYHAGSVCHECGSLLDEFSAKPHPPKEEVVSHET